MFCGFISLRPLHEFYIQTFLGNSSSIIHILKVRRDYLSYSDRSLSNIPIIYYANQNSIELFFCCHCTTPLTELVEDDEKTLPEEKQVIY